MVAAVNKFCPRWRYLGIGLIVFLWLSLPREIFAQNLSIMGRIVNSADGEPIATALISLLVDNNEVIRTAVSSRQGEFSLLVETPNNLSVDNLTLKVEKLGYEIALLAYSDFGKQSASPVTDAAALAENEAAAQQGDVITISLKKIRTLREYIVRSGARLANKERKSVATTTITAQDIESIKIRDARDLTATSANLFALNAESAFGSFFSLRGISSINTFDPLVVFYIDDIARFQSQNVPLYFSNVESIQILKGPQLTLYGRNAMAGVIDVKTRKPDKPFAVTLTAEGELPFIYSDPLADVQNNPLTVKGNTSIFFQTPFAYKDSYFRASAFLRGNDGIVRNTERNKLTGGDLSWDVASEFILPLTTTLALTLAGRYNSSITEIYPYAATIAEAFARPYQVTHNRDNRSERHTGEFTAQFTFEHAYFRLLSTSTYHNFTNTMAIDADFSDQDVAAVDVLFKQNVFTQELRFNSTSLSEKYFSWLVGVYFYLKDENYDLSFSLPLLALPDNEVTRIGGSELATGTALFTSFTFPLLAEVVALIIGNRVDIETRAHLSTNTAVYDENDPINVNINNPLINTNDETFVEAYYSGKLALTSTLILGLDHYVSFATGFRSGGVNLFTTLDSRTFYNNEYSLHTETGLKGDFTLITFSANFFYIYWIDQQITQAFTDSPGVFEFGIINMAGSSHNYGVEAESDWRLPYGMGLDTVIGYTESQYSIYTPKLTVAVGLKHTYSTRKGLFRHINRLEYRYLTDVYFELSRDENLKQKAYGLLNFSSSMYIGRSFFINLWLKNILDERYIAFVLPFGKLPSGPGSNSTRLEAAKLGDPITVGFKLAYTF